MPITGEIGRCDLAFVFDAGFGCGGAERVAVQLLRHWVQEGRTVALITMRGPEDDFYSVPRGVVRVVVGGIAQSSNVVAGLVRNALRLRRLRRALRESGAPVVLAFQTRTNVRTIFAALGLGKRVVLSERSDPSRQKFAWRWRVLRWCTYRFADAVTANSRNALDYLQAIVRKDKLVFTPNPVELPTALAAPSRSRIILTVGSLKWHKAHALLLDAFAQLPREAGGWSVELVGDGPERKRLEAVVVDRGLSARVHFTGAVRDPTNHYRDAAIFAFPSFFEGMPNALLEAMSHGLPCIVSNALVSALDHVQDGINALLFRSGDSYDLAAKLALLIADHDLRDRLGAAARMTMVELAASDRQHEAWNNVLWPCSGSR